jgi:hypothetical protein
LARSHTAAAINTLARIMRHPKVSPAARVMAAVALLDRGWGKPTQELKGDPDNPIKHQHESGLNINVTYTVEPDPNGSKDPA